MAHEILTWFFNSEDLFVLTNLYNIYRRQWNLVRECINIFVNTEGQRTENAQEW